MKKKYTKFLIDIDGVLIKGDKVIEGAIETITYLTKKNFEFVLITNITRITKAQLVEKLNKHGFNIDKNKVITPISATIAYIKSRTKKARCYLIAPDETEVEFLGSGLIITRNEEPVDYVILGYDFRTDFKMLDIACTSSNHLAQFGVRIKL